MPQRSAKKPTTPTATDPAGLLKEAKTLALTLLARRAYSTAELRRRILGRGFTLAVADQAIERMVELRYADDRAVFDALIGQAEREGRGPLWVWAKGQQRGLNHDAHRAHLSAAEPRLLATLPKVIAQQLRRRHGASDDVLQRRRRLQALLCRRGFSISVVVKAMQKLPAAAFAGAAADDTGDDASDDNNHGIGNDMGYGTDAGINDDTDHGMGHGHDTDALPLDMDRDIEKDGVDLTTDKEPS